MILTYFVGKINSTKIGITWPIRCSQRTMLMDSFRFIMTRIGRLYIGMTLSSCNPRQGHILSSSISTYYPERLGLAICIHHSPIFQAVWNAIKILIDPKTVAKMQMLRKKRRFGESFLQFFDEELATWLLEEVKLNKVRPTLASQRQFWRAVDDIVATTTTSSDPSLTNAKETIETMASRHDPRGCPSYVRQYVEPYLANYA